MQISKTMTNKQIAIFAIMAAFIMLFCYQACKIVDESYIQITDSTEHVAKFQKSILDKEVKVLRDSQRIYVDRWHDSKVIVKTKFDTVYKVVHDSVKPIIKELENDVLMEQKTAQMVHTSDSLIIIGLDGVIMLDSLLLAKAKQDLKLTNDTLAQVRKPKPLKRIWQTTKNVTIGAAIGAAIVELINIVK